MFLVSFTNKNSTLVMAVVLALASTLVACGSSGVTDNNGADAAWRESRTISYDGVPVQIIIDKPTGPVTDVLLTYHGTVWFDSLIVPASANVIGVFRRIMDRNDLLIVSVAYPQQDKFVGDGLREAEAALLWVKHRAAQELDIPIRRIFLGGHSQGAYIATRLNTMHQTDGVIANAPGPLDLEFRCLLEERGQIAASRECPLMVAEFGLPSENPSPYIERSLLTFAGDFKSDILFVQGLNDGPIQMRSWPMFQTAVQKCTNCAATQFLNIPGAGHDALFSNPQARPVFNQFINNRR
jgi:hypothetical protein